MKKIINGKRFDTETAECIKNWDNGCGSRDFNYRIKELYLTKTGNWFIYHEGGAMTDMAESCGSNSWCGGSNIEPISTEKAFNFLCKYNGEKEAEQYFPDMIKDA